MTAATLLDWTPLGLLLNVVGFWLILWDLVPRYQAEKRLKRAIMLQQEIQNVEVAAGKLCHQHMRVMREVGVELSQLLGESHRPSLDTPMSVRFLADLKRHLERRKRDVPSGINELECATKAYTELESGVINNIVRWMRDNGIDWQYWGPMHHRTAKAKRPAKKGYWSTPRNFLRTAELRIREEIDRRQKSLTRSPIILGGFLVTLGAALQFVGSVV